MELSKGHARRDVNYARVRAVREKRTSPGKQVEDINNYLRGILIINIAVVSREIIEITRREVRQTTVENADSRAIFGLDFFIHIFNLRINYNFIFFSPNKIFRKKICFFRY